MKEIHYPVKGRKIEEVFNQETVNKYFSYLESWHQGAGNYGRLNLHGCWGVTSVLDKRYQGETVSRYTSIFEMFMDLYDRFKTPKWRIEINSIVANLLYLQDKDGGFIHSTSEFEPTFNTIGCPIHFFNPIIVLCKYYMWPYADEDIKSMIWPAIERHWQFTLKNSWMRGNGGRGPCVKPGWCIVTNQDLTAVTALAYIGKAFGKWDLYNEYGKPTLDGLLEEDNYYKEIGLFERGDGKNFTERLPYYNIIINRLQSINELTGDERLPEIVDNIICHQFDAVYEGEDGFLHISRGAVTDPDDKSKVVGWDRSNIPLEAYLGMIPNMKNYLKRHPSAEKQLIVDRLTDTIAAYFFVDSCVPIMLKGANPIFTVVSNPQVEGFWEFIVDYLGDKLEEPKIVEIPKVCRKYQNFTCKHNDRLWSIEKDGVRQYGGYTRYVAGLTIGPDEKPVLGDFSDLEDYDYLEIID